MKKYPSEGYCRHCGGTNEVLDSYDAGDDECCCIFCDACNQPIVVERSGYDQESRNNKSCKEHQYEQE